MLPVENHIASEGNPFGYIKEDKIFLKSFLQYPEREIGTVKESETETIRYFENRFTQFEHKIEEVFSAIETAENKGSYLQKLLHLKELVGSYDGLGDFSKIFNIIIEKEHFLNDIIAQNRIKNLALKKALLQELGQLKESNDWINAGEAIKEIKNKWIRIGSVEKVVEDEVEAMFKEYMDTFYNRRQAFFDERNELNLLKLKKYELLAEKAELLKNSTDIRAAIDEFKKMGEEWKLVGLVPKKDLIPIQKRYKYAVDYFFRKIKSQKNQRTPQPAVPGGRFDRFEKMIAEVEKILLELPPYGDETVKKLQEEWRNSGAVRSDDFKRLEYKFKSNCTRVLDIYFVNRIAYKRNPNVKKLAPREQLKLQIGILKELIIRDSEQIENFENNFSKLEVNSQSNSFDKVFGAKLHSQKRNLESKKALLKELEEKLKTEA